MPAARRITTKVNQKTKNRPGASGSGGPAISDRWRYMALKKGDRLYVTELSPGVKGKKTRLFEVTGHELRFKAHSTVPEKLVQAFASAVKSAP